MDQIEPGKAGTIKIDSDETPSRKSSAAQKIIAFAIGFGLVMMAGIPTLNMAAGMYKVTVQEAQAK